MTPTSRWVAYFAAVLLGGCATHRPTPQAAQPIQDEAPLAATENTATEDAAAVLAADHSPAPSASALVFMAPVAYGTPPLNLDRSERAASAFMGFEGPTIEYYHVETYDSQIAGGYCPSGAGGCNFGGAFQDRYERRTYIDKYGSIRR
jgi:hypothetical protein